MVTTDSKNAHPEALTMLSRDFEAPMPNQKWLADTIYIPTDEGWVYLALVLDLHARTQAGGLGDEQDDAPGVQAAGAVDCFGLASSKHWASPWP